MTDLDLNLLATLDVLLAEGNVSRAARRLGLSQSAISRALARLRDTTGDPLLVRAGRGLVPTPRAVEMRERVSQLVQEAEAVLRPAEALDLKQLNRTFTLKIYEGFVEYFGPHLLARVAQEAPNARLRFVPRSYGDGLSLRDGTVDLETSILGRAIDPEVRAQALFRGRFIGVVRMDHPLSGRQITPSLYAASKHVGVFRDNLDKGPIDKALEAMGLERDIFTIVGSFSAAVALARSCDLIASVPERNTASQLAGMYCFDLPISLPGTTVSLLWHPRMERDPAHRWLRECIREVCAEDVTNYPLQSNDSPPHLNFTPPAPPASAANR